jgi:hypothetical protein
MIDNYSVELRNSYIISGNQLSFCKLIDLILVILDAVINFINKQIKLLT